MIFHGWLSDDNPGEKNYLKLFVKAEQIHYFCAK